MEQLKQGILCISLKRRIQRNILIEKASARASFRKDLLLRQLIAVYPSRCMQADKALRIASIGSKQRCPCRLAHVRIVCAYTHRLAQLFNRLLKQFMLPAGQRSPFHAVSPFADRRFRFAFNDAGGAGGGMIS